MLSVLFLVALGSFAAPSAPSLEVPDLSAAALMRSPGRLTGVVERVERSGGRRRSESEFTLRVEGVQRWEAALGEEPAVGARVRVRAWNQRLARGAVGSTGHRGPFSGPHGLPVAGDRVRVHLEGGADGLRVALPNGFTGPAVRVGWFGGGEAGALASAVRSALATKADIEVLEGSSAALGLEQGGRDRAHSAQFHVLAGRPLEPEVSSRALALAARDGRPMAALGQGLARIPADDEEQPTRDFAAEVFGLRASETVALMRVRIETAPGAAQHRLLAALPENAFAEPVFGELRLRPVELAPDARVLLVARAEGLDGLFPVLWVREAAPLPFDGDPELPRHGTFAPWRILATPLETADATVAQLLEHALRWTYGGW